jgi:hypothetical protein
MATFCNPCLTLNIFGGRTEKRIWVKKNLDFKKKKESTPD